MQARFIKNSFEHLKTRKFQRKYPLDLYVLETRRDAEDPLKHQYDVKKY